MTPIERAGEGGIERGNRGAGIGEHAAADGGTGCGARGGARGLGSARRGTGAGDTGAVWPGGDVGGDAARETAGFGQLDGGIGEQRTVALNRDIEIVLESQRDGVL